ncbi:MAG: hypothetical protein Q8N60_02920, partial [Candidatus Diapherotrites archaeon]|nr:hypothetical protein [Candidatus Diapherotrites archaeon]
MNKKFILVGLLLGLVLFSGCIKMQFKEVISESGMSDVTVTMDMSAFPTQPGAEEQNPCDSMTTDDSPLTDIKCTYENKVATVTAKFDRNGKAGFSAQDGKYRLDVKKAFEAFSSAGASGQSMPQTKEGMQQMKALGVVMDYIVKLPGAVTSQTGGTLQNDGSVKFDLLDMPDGAFVESSTAGFALDMNTLLIIGIVIAAIV